MRWWQRLWHRHDWVIVQSLSDFSIAIDECGEKYAGGVLSVAYTRHLRVCAVAGCDAVDDQISAFRERLRRSLLMEADRHGMAVLKLRELKRAGKLPPDFQFRKQVIMPGGDWLELEV